MIRVCGLSNSVGEEERHLSPYLALEKSLRDKQVPFYYFMEGVPWKWKRKVEWELELCERYPEDHFVFVDTWDYLFVGVKEELESIVYDGPPLFFSTDTGPVPWPEPHRAPHYESRREKLSPWCWLNGSGPSGQGKAIAEAIRWGLNHSPFREPPETDQSFWTMVYLYGGFGELDQMCRLTQALYDPGNPETGFMSENLGIRNGRFTNLVTLSRPQFIHATGHSWRFIPDCLLP